MEMYIIPEQPELIKKTRCVSIIVDRLLQNSARYLKYRSFVDNASCVLPMLKNGFNGKYIELDFSENLALRPKNEVKPAHFPGK